MNRAALALFPVALFSLAAKGEGCQSTEQPIVATGAGPSSDGALSGCCIGDASGTVVSISVAAESGAFVGACPSGYEHPNVCCVGVAGHATSCTESTSAPFDACDSAAETFPNPAKCCLLSDGSNCVDSPAGAPDASASRCANYCGPGGYAPPDTPNTPPGEQCCSGSDLNVMCATDLCGVAGGPSSPACGPQCDACPTGWAQSAQPDLYQPDLCCQPGPNGTTQCFSQAGYIPPPGAGATGACSSNGNTGLCECEQLTTDGHYDDVTCTESSGCVCTVDGVTTKTLSSMLCNQSLFAECGFAP